MCEKALTKKLKKANSNGVVDNDYLNNLLLIGSLTHKLTGHCVFLNVKLWCELLTFLIQFLHDFRSDYKGVL